MKRSFLYGSRDQELVAAINAFKVVDSKDVLFTLYNMLNVLDSKTSSLLRFNGILIAVVAILLRDVGSRYIEIAYVVLMLVSLLSCLIGFFVVKMGWPFLGKSRDPNDELAALAKAVDARTEAYQWAWTFSGISVLALVVLLIVDRL